MIQTSLAKRIATTAASGLMLYSLGATVCSAAEIKVLSSVALTSALDQIAPSFEQATGNKLNIGYSLIADIKKRMLDGETGDVIILSRPVMDELGKQEKFTSGSITNIAGTPVANCEFDFQPHEVVFSIDAAGAGLIGSAKPVLSDQGDNKPARRDASQKVLFKINTNGNRVDVHKQRSAAPFFAKPIEDIAGSMRRVIPSVSDERFEAMSGTLHGH
jgi:hypothetical protein